MGAIRGVRDYDGKWRMRACQFSFLRDFRAAKKKINTRCDVFIGFYVTGVECFILLFFFSCRVM